MTRERVKDVALAGLVASVAISCAGPAMDMAGEMFDDAGRLLGDAGQLLGDAGQLLGDAGAMMDDLGNRMMADAGAMLADAGGMLADAGSSLGDAGSSLSDAGSSLSDAGHAMRDSGSRPDGRVQAQDCGSCTAGLVQMIVTADQDPTRLVGETIERQRWTLVEMAYDVFGAGTNMPRYTYFEYQEAGDGPMLLTDIYGIAGNVVFYSVAAGSSCVQTDSSQHQRLNDAGNALETVTHDVYVIPSDARTMLGIGPGDRLSGARIYIPDDETLCVRARANALATSTAGTSFVKVMWSGFRPYD